MRIGVLLLPVEGPRWAMARAAELEAMGFDHLWTYDHLAWRRYADGPWHAVYPWLTAVATATERVRLGTMVANPNVRHPVVLAKDAMTIDHVSDGRFTLGIGAGGTGIDHRVLGQEPLEPAQRADRFEEWSGMLDRLLRGDTSDHHGDWFSNVDARMAPGCVQQPRVPLAVAAAGPRLLRFAADVADAWITEGDRSGPDPDRSAAGTRRAVRQQWAVIEDRCSQTGRDPSDLDRILLAGNTDEQPLASVDAFEDFVGRYAELGITDVVVHHPRAGDPHWDQPVEVLDQVAAALPRLRTR